MKKWRRMSCGRWRLGRRTKSEFFLQMPGQPRSIMCLPGPTENALASNFSKFTGRSCTAVASTRDDSDGSTAIPNNQWMGSMGANMKSKMDTPVLVLHKHTGSPLCGTVLYGTVLTVWASWHSHCRHSTASRTRHVPIIFDAFDMFASPIRLAVASCGLLVFKRTTGLRPAFQLCFLSFFFLKVEWVYCIWHSNWVET